jgi:glycosyltransferase involved in cell wall biosynthesis
LASVVVPVRDGGTNVVELLSALAAQTLPREQFEVLIGDDGSTDRATEAVHDADSWARVFPGPPLNSYAARNRAARAAGANVLAFCDADCRPEPRWLEAGLLALGDADLVAGPVRFIVPTGRSAWSLLDMELFLNQELAISRGRAVTANLFVRRDLFQRMGGFDETLANGGDRVFVTRCVEAGAKLRLAEAAVVWHPTRDRARQLLRKVWATSRRAGMLQARSGMGPGIRSLTFWVPPYDMATRRRWNGSPLTLDRRRLEKHGVRITLADELRALPLMYLVVPVVMRVARTIGWIEERSPRRKTARKQRGIDPA